MAGLRILPAGDAALLVELDCLDAVLALFRVASIQRPEGVTDLVPAARTLLAQFQPSVVTPGAVAAWLRRCWRESADRLGVSAGDTASPRNAADIPYRTVEIPVHYTGADLDEVAGRLGLSRAELIERHTAHEFQAAFAGFAPGFVYLTGGDPCFHGLPRRASPRTRVPAGSVAAAGEFSAVYPAESPGGWQLLGVTPLRMWDLGRAEPALVQPGFRVRFRDLDAPGTVVGLPSGRVAAGCDGARPGDGGPVSLDGPADARADASPDIPAAPGSPGTVSGASAAAVPYLEVLGAGLQTLFQDLGRPGLTGMGVSCSGALDRGALRQANRLVGNRPDAAVLENALGGLRLVCRGRAVVAVTGAQAPVVLTTASGVRLPAVGGRALTMEDGQILRIGRPRAGVRCYVAVQGGWAVPPVLGSRATDVLAGIGPGPVRAGDRLVVGRDDVGGDPIPPAPGRIPGERRAAAEADTRSGAKAGPESVLPLPRPGDAVTLDVVPGPRDDWFRPEALERLRSQEWLVTPQSNRVGMRLSGPEPLPRRRTGELPSEGTVTGAIQVPANGQPVLFLADHPLTGGYPVIAVVHSRELDRLGQVPVGARLRFRFVET